MNAHQYFVAASIGREHATDRLSRRCDDDFESFDDAVFPDAFAEALDALPTCEAPEVSDAVHAAIREVWDVREETV